MSPIWVQLWCVNKKGPIFLRDWWQWVGQIEALNALFSFSFSSLFFIHSFLFTWPVELTSYVHCIMTNGKDWIFIMTIERMNLFSYNTYCIRLKRHHRWSWWWCHETKATADKRYASFIMHIYALKWVNTQAVKKPRERE